MSMWNRACLAVVVASCTLSIAANAEKKAADDRSVEKTAAVEKATKTESAPTENAAAEKATPIQKEKPAMVSGKKDKGEKAEKATVTSKKASVRLPSKLEVRVNGSYLFPGEDLFWDKAYGAEAKLIYWVNKNVGVALAAGAQKWTVNEDLRTFAAEDMGDGYEFLYGEMLEGDALMFPLGGSVMFQYEVLKKLNLSVEGGLRYVLINSDAKLTAIGVIIDSWYDDAIVDYAVNSYDLDFENEFIGLVAADISYAVYKNISLFVGGGFQFDITRSKPTLSVDGEDEDTRKDNALKASFVRGGASVLF